MKKKLIIINSIITVVLLVFVFILGVTVTKDNNYQTSEREVKRLTAVYADYYKDNESVRVTDGDLRVTVVDATGKVIYESENIDISKAENHLSREEILSALDGHSQVVVRKSQTMNVDMMYYAEKVDVGESYVFVRVAVPMETINAFVIKSVPAVVMIVVFALLAELFLSILLGFWAVKPLSSVKTGLQSLNSGNFKHVMPTENDADLNAMIVEINDLGDKIQNLIVDSEKERNKLDFILNHITDGVVAFDCGGDIILANNIALDIFGVKKEIVGENFRSLTENEDILRSVEKCVNGDKSYVFETESGGRSYLLNLKRTEDEIIIMVVADVTERKKNEQTRSEFFANASHELKTPLTSLKGFNELALMKESDATVKEYLLQAQKDVNRMLALIEDMLKLTVLEHTEAENVEKVDLQEIAREVVEELKPTIAEKNLSVSVSGFAAVQANKGDIYTLQKNLIENAVRYTEKNGEIAINITNGSGVTFAVKDNGIGIDEKHQQRIFERFYRVEKSRSRQSGGTGLGLSIVKHIAERYGASISLSSKEGVGTTVKVKFNK